jgi:hypothetical protein
LRNSSLLIDRVADRWIDLICARLVEQRGFTVDCGLTAPNPEPATKPDCEPTTTVRACC